MEKYIKNLKKSVLFKEIREDEIIDLISNLNYIVQDYEKDSTIAIEGDPCSGLGIILRGNIEIHKPYPSGKVVTISNFTLGEIFGESLVFSDKNKYPATVISSTPSTVMYLSKFEAVRLMQKDERILSNFASVLSNRILMLNDRITNLSYDTIRKKIANIILSEYKKQKNKNLVLPFCRRKMAELLNIPRPSLSRELMKMKSEGIIDYQRNKMRIIDLQKLEETLFD